MGTVELVEVAQQNLFLDPLDRTEIPQSDPFM